MYEIRGIVLIDKLDKVRLFIINESLSLICSKAELTASLEFQLRGLQIERCFSQSS